MRLFALFLCCGLIGQRAGQASTQAQFRTPLGDIEVELFDQDKPATVANFIRYVEAGLYTNLFIHRWEPGFVIQGGGYVTADRQQTNAGIAFIPTFPAVTNEYGVGRVFSNLYGTIAMARASGETNSATSQWFFNLTNNAFLDQVDGGFTVFGQLLRGTNVLDRFNLTSTNNGIYRYDLGGALNHVPALSVAATLEDLLEDLVYVDISLLRVQVQGLAAGRQISWNSVSNKVNRVEFTTQMPPVWTVLISTNGTGQQLKVIDPQTDALHRFYRVRVDY